MEVKLASSFYADETAPQSPTTKQQQAACPEQCQTLCAFPV